MVLRLKSGLDNYRLFLIVLFGGAFVLRLSSLTARSLWLDEYTSIEIASKSLSEIVGGAGFDRHTPPFYYLVLHAWFTVFSPTEFSLRFLALIFDLFNLWLVFVIFSEQLSRRIGQLLAMLYACSPFAIYYAQEGRMYSMLLCFVLITYFLALRGLRDKGNWNDLIVLILVGCCGMYTHYYYALSLVGISLALLLSQKWKLVRGWALSLVAIGLFFTPWFTVLLELSAGPGQTFRRHVFSVLPYTVFRFFAGYGVFPLTPALKGDLYASVMENLAPIIAYGGLFSVTMCLGIKQLWGTMKAERRLFFLAACVPPLLALGISLITPMLSERYLIVSFPFALVLVGLGIGTSPTQSVRKSLALLLAMLVCYSLWAHYRNKHFGNTQWRDAAAYLSSQAPEGATVFVSPPYAAGVLRYYLHAPHLVYPFDRNILTADISRDLYLVEQGTVSTAQEFIEQNKYLPTTRMEFPLENGLSVIRLK